MKPWFLKVQLLCCRGCTFMAYTLNSVYICVLFSSILKTWNLNSFKGRCALKLATSRPLPAFLASNIQMNFKAIQLQIQLDIKGLLCFLFWFWGQSCSSWIYDIFQWRLLPTIHCLSNLVTSVHSGYFMPMGKNLTYL